MANHVTLSIHKDTKELLRKLSDKRKKSGDRIQSMSAIIHELTQKELNKGKK